MMCTIPPGDEGGQDACYNDNGGPLMCTTEESGESILCGLISHGNGCGWPGVPSVFTELSYYATWILENTRS